MSNVNAATLTVTASDQENLASSREFEGYKSVKVVVRTTGTSVYLGNGSVAGASTGFLMLPDKDYEVILNSPTELSAVSSTYTLYVYNAGGSSATVTYFATPHQQ